MTTNAARSLRFALALSALALASSGAAQAQVVWSGTGTNWGAAGAASTSWVGGTAPSLTQVAEFTGTFTNQPALPAGDSTGGIWVTGSTAGGNGGLVTLADSTHAFGINGLQTINGIANVAVLLDGAGNTSLTVTATASQTTNLTLAGATGTSMLVNNAGTLTWGQTITMPTGGLTLGSNTSTGAGSIILSGPATGGNLSGAAPVTISNTAGGSTSVAFNSTIGSSYSGVTTVASGMLYLGFNAPSAAIGSLGNSATAVNLGTTTTSTATTVNATAGVSASPAGIETDLGGLTIARNITEVSGAVNTSLTIGGTQTSGAASVFTGNITLTAPTNFNSATGGTVNFNTGTISGAVNVTLTGGGLIQFVGGTDNFGSATLNANSMTFTGGTTLLATANTNFGASGNELIFNNGALEFGAVFDPSGSRTMLFNSGGAIFNTNGNTITFANPVGNSGTGGLTLNDTNATPGTLILSAANAYSGPTVIQSGTLELNILGALQNTSAVTFKGGTLLYTANNTRDLSGIITGSTGPISIRLNSQTINYANSLAASNTGGLTVNDLSASPGSLTLAAGGAYTGPTTVTKGAFNIGGSLSATAVTIANGASFQVGANGSTTPLSIGGAGVGSLTLNSGSAFSLANAALNSLTVNSSTASSTVLTLGGSTMTFDVGGGSAGAQSTDELILGSGLLANISGANIIKINIIGAGLNGTSQQLISWASGSGPGSFTLGTTTGSTAYSLNLSTIASGPGAGLYLNEIATTPAFWSGSVNSSWAAGFPGGPTNFVTSLGGGTDRSTIGALDTNTAVTFAATGASSASYANTTLDANTTINSLTYNVGGVGIASGTGGPNTLTITSGGNGITVATGLGLTTETISSNVAIGSTQTWSVGDAASTLLVSGNISGTGFGLNKGGLGTLVFSGTNSYTGATSVLAGALSLQSAGALGGTSGVTVTGGAALQLAGSGFTTTAATPLTLSGTGPAGNGALENVSGANTYTGLITLTAATTIGSDSGSLTLSNTGTIVGGGFALTLTGAGNGTLASIIDPTTSSLTKAGNGTWTLSGANTMTGGITINAGTLTFSGTGTAGAAANPVTINNGGTFDLGGTNQTVGVLTGTSGATITDNGAAHTLSVSSGTYAGAINNGSGPLSLAKITAGTFVLSGTGTYTGTTTATLGTLSLTGSITGSNLLVNGGTFTESAAGVIGGAGATVTVSSGTATLSGTNTYGGGTVLTGGTLDITSASALGSTTALTVGTGASFQITGPLTTVAGLNLTLNGTGTAGLGALESVIGANVFPGLITLGSAASIGSDAGTLNVSNTGTVVGGGNGLTLAGAANGTFASVLDSTTSSLTKSGAGTWTLTGTYTSFSGLVTINAGTLTLGGVEPLASVTLNGGALNLGPTNGISGVLTLNGGTLAFASTAQLPSGTITMGSGTNAVGLNYTGTVAGTISAPLNFAGTTGGITLSNSGTAPINYTGTPNFSGVGAKTITLGNVADTFGGSIGGITNAGGSAVAVTKNGANDSIWVLTGGDTHTGVTTITGGVIDLSTGMSDLASTSTLTLNGSNTNNAVFESSGVFSRATGTNNNNAQAGGVNWENFSGFAAQGGNLVVTLTGSSNGTLTAFSQANPLVWGGQIVASGGTGVTFGAKNSDSQVELTNALVLCNNGFTVGTARSIFIDAGTGTDSTLFSGILYDPQVAAAAYNASPAFTKSGGGTLILSGANGFTGTAFTTANEDVGNAFTGAVVINAGTVVAAASSSPATPITQTVATGGYTLGATTIPLNSVTGLAVGQIFNIAGGGIPAGTYITAIAGNTVTISQATTGAGTAGQSLVASVLPATVSIGTTYTTGVNTITLTSVAGLQVGQIITIPGVAGGAVGTIQEGTYITAINQSTNTITLSQNTVGAGTAGQTLIAGTPGVFGIGYSSTGTVGALNPPVFLSATNNASPSLQIGGGGVNGPDTVAGNYTIYSPVDIGFTVAGVVGTVGATGPTATTGTYTIGGNTANPSTFAGLISGSESFRVTQATGGTLSINGGITGGTGNVASTVSFANAGTVNVGSVIGGGVGTLAVTQAGAGVTSLSAANTYTGVTNINAGTLLANAQSGSSTGTGAVNVNAIVTAGAIVSEGTLGGTGIINSASAVTVNSGGQVNLVGPTIGTLSISGAGGLTINGGAPATTTGPAATPTGLTFAITNNGGSPTGTLDSIAVAGALTVTTTNGVPNITIVNQSGNSSLTSGSYALFTYTGTAPALSSFNLATTILDGNSLSLTQGTGVIDLSVITLTSGTYNLAVTNGRIMAGTGTTATVNTQLINPGATSDTINYTALNASVTGGTGTGSITGGTAPGTGGPVANNGGIGSATVVVTNNGSTAGQTIVLTPSVGTTTNANIGGSPTLGTTTAGTINVVGNRTETTSVPTVALGRVLLNGATTAPVTFVSVTGQDSSLTRTSLGGSIITATNPVATTGSITAASLLAGTAYQFGGLNDATNQTTQNLSITLGTLGANSGSFNLTPQGEGLNGEVVQPISVAYTATAVGLRSITNGATTNLGIYHAGESVSITSNPFTTTTGDNATTTSVTVAQNSTTPVDGLSAGGSGTTLFNGTTGSDTRTITGSITGSGNITGTINVGVTSAENGGAGIGDTYAPVGINFAATVYSGAGVWTGAGGGTTSWGTLGSNFATNWTAAGGSPGVDTNFTHSDTATFNSAGAGTVTLDGAAPSLAGITFTAGGYNIGQGSGSTGITLNNGVAGTATVTNTVGPNTISAPIALASNNTTVNVGASQILNLTGNITGATANLNMAGPGILEVTGNNTYGNSNGTTVTTITGGTFFANSPTSSTGVGEVTVSSGATLAGNGVIAPTAITAGNAALDISGKIAPSNNSGVGFSTLTLSLVPGAAVSLETSATFGFNLGAPNLAAGVGSDFINILNDGQLDLTGQNFSNFNFTTEAGFGSAAGQYILLATATPNAGDIQGNLGSNLTGFVNGLPAVISIDPNGQDLLLNITAVPEPGTWALMLCGLALLVIVQRLRRKQQS